MDAEERHVQWWRALSPGERADILALDPLAEFPRWVIDSLQDADILITTASAGDRVLVLPSMWTREFLDRQRHL